MKIEMYVNDFCPDNCKYYKQLKEMSFDGIELVSSENTCENKELCYHAYHLRDEVAE